MGWKGKKPTEFSFDVAKTAEDHVKNIVMDTVQSLVNLSPVDTGAYRASHIVSIRSAD
ncbi:HK97 gp10 family phage protein, partial [Acinetobacter baumannii]|nr:HK97 gp10 family phage protein [Acinetobacter baumannii]